MARQVAYRHTHFVQPFFRRRVLRCPPARQAERLCSAVHHAPYKRHHGWVFHPPLQDRQQLFVAHPVKVFAYVQFQAVPARPRLALHLAHPVLQALGGLMAALALSASVGILNKKPVIDRIQIQVQAPLHNSVRVVQRHHQPLLGHIHPQLAVRPQHIAAVHHTLLYDEQIIFEPRGKIQNLGAVSLALAGVPVSLNQPTKIAHHRPSVLNHRHFLLTVFHPTISPSHVWRFRLHGNTNFFPPCLSGNGNRPLLVCTSCCTP